LVSPVSTPSYVVEATISTNGILNVHIAVKEGSDVYEGFDNFHFSVIARDALLQCLFDKEYSYLASNILSDLGIGLYDFMDLSGSVEVVLSPSSQRAALRTDNDSLVRSCEAHILASASDHAIQEPTSRGARERRFFAERVSSIQSCCVDFGASELYSALDKSLSLIDMNKRYSTYTGD